MKMLLSSAGMTNASITSALEELLGKPVSESRALVVMAATYAIPNGPEIAWKVFNGLFPPNRFCDMEWKSMGVLELTALPSLKEECWLPDLRAADALLVNGGDCQYLTYWMNTSGLADLIPSLHDTVYVGLSAGSMIMTSHGTTFGCHTLPSDTPKTLGRLKFAILPHADHVQFPDNSMANLEIEAAGIPVPSYAIDDQTAIKVTDAGIDVISEGTWKLFNAERASHR
jgi:dipeptidase E